MIEVLTRKDYYGASCGPAPRFYVAPYVHPDECDHEIDPGVPDVLCSQCCPCDECGVHGRVLSMCIGFQRQATS